MKFNVRLLYLYLFSFVGLLITIIGSIQIVDLTLKAYIFKVSEYSSYPLMPIKGEDGEQTITVEEQQAQQTMETANQQKRQLSTSLAMIAVGAPLYLYHWRTIKSENKA